MSLTHYEACGGTCVVRQLAGEVQVGLDALQHARAAAGTQSHGADVAIASGGDAQVRKVEVL